RTGDRRDLTETPLRLPKSRAGYQLSMRDPELTRDDSIANGVRSLDLGQIEPRLLQAVPGCEGSVGISVEKPAGREDAVGERVARIALQRLLRELAGFPPPRLEKRKPGQLSQRVRGVRVLRVDRAQDPTSSFHVSASCEEHRALNFAPPHTGSGMINVRSRTVLRIRFASGRRAQCSTCIFDGLRLRP